MLKTAMLVSALAISIPVFAQDTPTAGTTSPSTATTSSTDPAATTQDSATPTTAQSTPASDATTATQQAAAPTTTPATAPAETAAATTTTSEPVKGASQIATVVNTEFPTYDKNADSNLDKTEFGAWMVALKTASDPATKATDPATVTWVNGAFASADLDKSSAVSKDELTKYLSQGAE